MASQITKHGRFDAHATLATARRRRRSSGVNNIIRGVRCARPKMRYCPVRGACAQTKGRAKQWPEWMFGCPSLDAPRAQRPADPGLAIVWAQRSSRRPAGREHRRLPYNGAQGRRQGVAFLLPSFFGEAKVRCAAGRTSRLPPLAKACSQKTGDESATMNSIATMLNSYQTLIEPNQPSTPTAPCGTWFRSNHHVSRAASVSGWRDSSVASTAPCLRGSPLQQHTGHQLVRRHGVVAKAAVKTLQQGPGRSFAARVPRGLPSLVVGRPAAQTARLWRPTGLGRPEGFATWPERSNSGM